MALRRYSVLLGGWLLGAVSSSHAQATFVVSDSAHRPVSWLLKVGLRLPHSGASYAGGGWLLPLASGVEYRLVPAFSIYGQLEADVLAASATTRRRATTRATLPDANLSLGVRYYYQRPRHAGEISREFGRYLALEGNCEGQQATTTQARRRQRTLPLTLTPGLYVLWGSQNRVRRRVLYDFNAGLGVLAPTHYPAEQAGRAPHWDVGVQANGRLFFGN